MQDRRYNGPPINRAVQRIEAASPELQRVMRAFGAVFWVARVSGATVNAFNPDREISVSEKHLETIRKQIERGEPSGGIRDMVEPPKNHRRVKPRGKQNFRKVGPR
jgi:hypothetical protein